MQVHDLLTNNHSDDKYSLISQRCSDYLRESQNLPLLKSLPTSYNDFHKVKVRKRKKKNSFDTVFNEAFEHEHFSIRQRAIFAKGKTNQPENNMVENFYIFPIDGFKFMYSKEVEQSGSDYRQVFETMFNKLGEEKSMDILSDLLRFTYNSTNLYEGIKTGAEIIIYGIPYYYAIRTSCHDSYKSLLSHIV